MNEKKLLLILLILIFIIFSLMSFMIIESRIRETQMNYLLNYEQYLGNLYHIYTSQGSLEDQMKPHILGFGFYNYYGDPLFVYGTAKKKVTDDAFIPFFNHKRKSIAVQRDLLNPFSSIFRNPENKYESSGLVIPSIDGQSEDDLKRMIRYAYLEIKDSSTYTLMMWLRILQIIMPLIIILIVFFMRNLYIRNLSYRQQIASQERLVVIGTASRTLTHEIKNPLSSIRLQTTIIRRSGCTLHNAPLKIINDEVERLSLLTERIGDFLRHPEGKPVVTNLNNTLCFIMERYSHKISYQVQYDPCSVLIDPGRFRSIVENILNNALESGSDPERINLIISKDREQCHILLSDEGRGIPEESRKHLFDPFFTTKSTGSGVGLSIVRSFVDAAGGNITIQSIEGAGTTVHLYFPLAKGDA